MSLTDLFFMALLMLRELIIAFPWLSLLIVLVLFIPWMLALARGGLRGLKSTLWPAAIFALICGIVAFITLPMFFDAGLGHMRYLTDWMFHIASTASIVGYAFLVAIPALLLMRRN